MELEKIEKSLKNEFSLYNKKLKNEGGQDSDFFIGWRNTVIAVSQTIKSIFYDLYKLRVDVYFDVNYEYIDYVSIEDDYYKILKTFYIEK